MADSTPSGKMYAFGGIPVVAADMGFATIEPSPQEAFEYVLGQSPGIVDLLNSTNAPHMDTYTQQILIRAPDSITDPVAAWQFVIAGMRAIQGMPETGQLVVFSDPSAGATVSCTARRRRFKWAPEPKNARHYVVEFVAVLLSNWA